MSVSRPSTGNCPPRSSFVYQNREKRQASSLAAPTTTVETPQPVPELVSVEVSEYEQNGKHVSGSYSKEGYFMAICCCQNYPRSLYVLSI